MILEHIEHPSDIRGLDAAELGILCDEIRTFIVDTVSVTGGHLGSNLGAVEMTVALHRVFDSPRDLVIFDTGHQAYVHKLLTGRRKAFSMLRQEGGLSGYPNRSESQHDWVENSHASTSLSWAHGLASALGLGAGPPVGSCGGSVDPDQRRVVAVIGDGALTGGLAYEALNNLGHSDTPVIIVLNDNGRSYAPTVSKLSESLTKLRLSPTYVSTRRRVKAILEELPPALGPLARSSLAGLTSAVREAIEPHVFFEALGVRYTGPIDGHDIAAMESAFVKAAAWQEGPIVVHVLTQKGKGYGPAEDDPVTCLHDLKVAPAMDPDGSPAGGGVVDGGLADAGPAVPTYIDVFTQAMLDEGGANPAVVALTAAMPGSVGLLPFAAAYPGRCFDVGIAEAHAVTAAAGMAMGGLRPVVALYATFFSRAFDQVNLDVGLHRLPVVFALCSAGITGVDGPSHHGILDMAQCLSVPQMVVFAPSSPAEVATMLTTALTLDVPCSIRFTKTPYVRPVLPAEGAALASPMSGRKLRAGDGSVCLLAVGKMLSAACNAATLLEGSGISATVWDVRVVRPPDPAMLADAASHELVVTIEDGIRTGGAGSHLADALGCLDTGTRPPCVLNLGVPHAYVPHGGPESILRRLGLSGPGIASSTVSAMQRWGVTSLGVDQLPALANHNGSAPAEPFQAATRRAGS
ncbi:MAG: 1-deoxy-D-xylulose-5-phosphate synthase [Acidimicrobiales bacterium]